MAWLPEYPIGSQSFVPEYLNDVPDGNGGERCRFEYGGSVSARHCGLPAFEHTPDGPPLCEFHSLAKSPCMGERLAGATASGADLHKARLAGTSLSDADLSGAKLTSAVLVGASLARTRLCGAQLGRADLSGAELSAADLRGANLYDATLSGADLSRARLTGADMRHALVASLAELMPQPPSQLGLRGITRPTTLRSAALHRAMLTQARLAPETDFLDAEFGLHSRDVIEEEATARTPAERKEVALLYRQLKLCFQHSGDHVRAGEFFIREMHCIWQQRKAEGNWRWIPGALLEYLCGFGERPWRMLGWMLGIIALFAFLHTGWGQIEHLDVGLGFDPSLAGVERFWRAVYFSVETFTTLGYGDLTPKCVCGYILCSLEPLVGTILVSLFLVCIVRKFSRCPFPRSCASVRAVR